MENNFDIRCYMMGFLDARIGNEGIAKKEYERLKNECRSLRSAMEAMMLSMEAVLCLEDFKIMTQRTFGYIEAYKDIKEKKGKE